MREAKVNKSELARRLDWHMPQVDRVLDVHHASQLDQLDAAFGALGKHLLATGPYRGSVGRFASSAMTGVPRPRSRASSGLIGRGKLCRAPVWSTHPATTTRVFVGLGSSGCSRTATADALPRPHPAPTPRLPLGWECGPGLQPQA